MMKLNLIGSKEDRQYVMEQNNAGEIDLIDMLKKYGEVADYMTSNMVAQFYNIDNNTLQKVATRNGDELSNYGYRVVKGEELDNLRSTSCTLQISPKTRSVRLFPIKATILIGMMLTESVVAAKLRRDIMNKIFNPSFFQI